MLRLALAAAVMLATAPTLTHFGLLPPRVGLAAFVLSGAFGLVATAWGGVSWLRHRRRARPIIAVVLGLAPTLAVAAPIVVATAAGHPRAGDVTTNTADPPAVDHAHTQPALDGVDLSYPERIAAGHPDLRTLELAAPPAVVFERAVALVRSRDDWKLTFADPATGVIEGVATSAVFRLEDDFAIRVRPRRGARSIGAAVDMRSRSRLGHADLGGNARRIRGFLRDLRAAVGEG